MKDKKILFDFITLQDNYINGGSIFTWLVLNRLLAESNCIYGLYDSKKIIPHKLKEIIENYNICLYPINKLKLLNEFIDKNKLSVFFIGISQRYNKYDLSNLNIHIKVYTHDISDLALLSGNKIYNEEIQSFYLKNCELSLAQRFKQKIVLFLCKIKQFKFLRNRIFKSYKNFRKLVKSNKVEVFTVSEYSKNCLEYYFDIKNPVKVFAPLLKNKESNLKKKQQIQNYVEGKKFFLLISSERINKNCKIFIEVWNRFCEKTNFEYYAIIVGKLKIKMRNLICINYLENSELEWLYSKAYTFIYPSIYEGYGIPPVECMKFGTPVICSNVTSLPEIYGDSVLYFSPFYPEDLYRALLEVIRNRRMYTERAIQKAKIIFQSQEIHSNNLLKEIFE